MEPNTNKYFVYVRKSTRGDRKQTLSINSQLKALNKLVHEQKLNVVGKFTERQSAHTPGRPEFKRMLQRIEAGEADGIIAWHPDRLARNSRDGGEIIYLIDTGKIVDLKFCTFWFENTPQGKSMLGHEFVQTKQFSDKLSCDTHRGLHDKARMGHFPSIAPRGYLNDKATKTIALDHHQAPVIRKAFELYATGKKSIEDILDFLTARGVLTRDCGRWGKGGSRISQDKVRNMLRNPFYYGHFRYGGELHEGKHVPIITKALFEKVQQVMERRGHTYPQKREPKPFTGLLRCAECSRFITAEEQRSYTYYRCTKKGRQCSQPYVRAEILDQELTFLLADYTLSVDHAKSMLAMLAKEQNDLELTNQRALQVKQEELIAVTAKLEQLVQIYLLKDIEREVFLREKVELLSQKKAIQECINGFDDNHYGWLEQFRDWIRTAQTIGQIAETGSPQEKKQALLKVFGSNLELRGKKARGCALKPWLYLAQNHSSNRLVPLYRTARNHFMKVSDRTPAIPAPLPTVGNPLEYAMAA